MTKTLGDPGGRTRLGPSGGRELELGETDDPRQLVWGDTARLDQTVTHLREVAQRLERAGQQLRRTDVGGWSGPAADQFHTTFAETPKRWLSASDVLTSAAARLGDFDTTVAWAQAQAGRAVALYQHGQHASQQARAAYETQVRSYNAAVEAAQRGEVGPPGSPPTFTDPGAEELRQAQEVLARARHQRDLAATAAADALRAAAATAPTPTPVSGGASRGEKGRSPAGRFLAGLGEGAEEIVKLARTVNPLDPYNLTHPAQAADNITTVLAGAAHTTVHPTELVTGVVGTGWGSDPAHAVGKLLPNIVAGLATDGVGATAARATVSAERATVTTAGRGTVQSAAQKAGGEAPALRPEAAPLAVEPGAGRSPHGPSATSPAPRHATTDASPTRPTLASATPDPVGAAPPVSAPSRITRALNPTGTTLDTVEAALPKLHPRHPDPPTPSASAPARPLEHPHHRAEVEDPGDRQPSAIQRALDRPDPDLDRDFDAASARGPEPSAGRPPDAATPDPGAWMRAGMSDHALERPAGGDTALGAGSDPQDPQPPPPVLRHPTEDPNAGAARGMNPGAATPSQLPAPPSPLAVPPAAPPPLTHTPGLLTPDATTVTALPPVEFVSSVEAVAGHTPPAASPAAATRGVLPGAPAPAARGPQGLRPSDPLEAPGGRPVEPSTAPVPVLDSSAAVAGVGVRAPIVRDAPFEQRRELREPFVGENDLTNLDRAFHPLVVEYMDPVERDAHRLFVRDGLLYWAKDATPLDTTGVPGYRAIFVVDAHGNFYASLRPVFGTLHHSSFLAGEPVAGAGEIAAVAGIPTLINRASGHYQPELAHGEQVRDALADQGVDTSKIRFDSVESRREQFREPPRWDPSATRNEGP